MWKIDRDYISDPGEESRVGTTEEHTRVPLIAVIALGAESEDLPTKDDAGNDLPLVRFRMKDDDGEVYYGGELHDDDECLNQEAALSYGMGDAGCTTIEVKRDGEWVLEIS